MSAASREHRGTIFPQPRLSNGTPLDDQIGYRTALLMATARQADIDSSVLESLQHNGVVVISSDGEPEIARCLSDRNADAIAIRPDRYVLGSATGRAEIETLIRNLLA